VGAFRREKVEFETISAADSSESINADIRFSEVAASFMYSISNADVYGAIKE
jgi:hypothetical protein